MAQMKTRRIWLLELRHNGVLQGDGEFWPTRTACIDQFATIATRRDNSTDPTWEARITSWRIPNPRDGWRALT